MDAPDSTLDQAVAAVERGAETEETIGRPRLRHLWHTSVALGFALRRLWSETGGARSLAEALSDPVASVALSTVPAGVFRRWYREDVLAAAAAPLTAIVRCGLTDGFASSAGVSE